MRDASKKKQEHCLVAVTIATNCITMETSLSEALLNSANQPATSLNNDLTEPLVNTANNSSSNNNNNRSEDHDEQVQDGLLVAVSSTATTANQAPTTSPLPPATMSSSFVAAVALAAMPMFLFGFNTGVMNAPESVIFPSHSVLEWSIAVSAFCVGGFFGANVSGRLADVWGRRPCLAMILVANVIFGVLHVLSPNMIVLIAARAGVGVAGGASTVLTPMYLSEISPSHIRGSIGTMTQFSCVVGILASILWALPFCTVHTWRIIFVPLPILAGLGLLAIPWGLPESPKWLLMNHYVARGQEARGTMARFRNFHEERDAELIEMEVMLSLGGGANNTAPSPLVAASATEGDRENQEEEADFEEEEGTSSGELRRQTSFTTTGRSFRSFALDPKNRIPLISAILFPVAQQLSGINAVFYYSTLFFDGVIPNPQTGTILAFSVNVLATVVAVLAMDRFGRKTLFSVSAGGMFLGCILLTMALKGMLPGFCTVLAVMLYICFFEIGLGCIPFFLASEMIEPEFLGTVQSISMTCNWFANFCVGIMFPFLDKHLGAYSFVPFAVVLLFTTLYSLFVLPETRGKSLEEVLQQVNSRGGVYHAQVVSEEEDGPGTSRQGAFIEADTALV